MKTKLGISVGLLAAMVYLCTLFGGYTPLLLIAGYVVLVEKNETLTRVAIKALCVAITFSTLSALVGLIPDAISIISSTLSIVSISIAYYTILTIESVLISAISLARTLVLLGLAYYAYSSKDLAIKPIDKMMTGELKIEIPTEE